MLKFALPGQWEPRSELTKGVPNRYPFYETSTGSLMYIQQPGGTQPPKESPSPEALSETVKRMAAPETFWGENPHPYLARFIAVAFFPLPQSYHKATAGYFSEIKSGGKAEPVDIWDAEGIERDAQVFYTSQLTPRIIATNRNNVVKVGEEYAPLRVTRAEQLTVAKGDALVYEMETEKAAIDRAVERFGMPESLKNQRIRYSLVLYAPTGFAAGTPVAIVVAAPVSSSLDCNLLVEALRQADGQR